MSGEKLCKTSCPNPQLINSAKDGCVDSCPAGELLGKDGLRCETECSVGVPNESGTECV